ncbi:hypothetical protein [Hymenobacter guriensis]|uniref:Pyridoxamine 5'-phosphate oxidase putative domain-containing protein n=1 Tax=Hymenobacter guriensis TaxID=2793065 RepID=A0ABS0L4D6_9BACT|nr:hypothetical protein [Hymenobacter guriensis]MBG8554805.1 hypothetical protein [Hymenobacter guriensis]
MIHNAPILLEQVGATLLDGRVDRIMEEGESGPLITYLQFHHANGNQWLAIISTDEQTMTHLAEEAEVVIGAIDKGGLVSQISSISDVFPAFEPFIGRRLLAVTELIDHKWAAFSFGVKLYFEGGLTFAVWNQDYPIDQNCYIFNGPLPDVVVETPVQ